MRLKEFARTGRKLPEIGLGTYYDPLWVATAFLGWKRGATAKIEAIKAGLDSGVALLDTAEIYKSESLVARAIEARKREEIFLASKVWPNHLHGDALVRAFEKSLKRLGTSYMDLYQVHWPNPMVPIRETMAAMERLVGDGRLLHVGVSNFNLKQIREAQAALPKSELSSVQLNYSLIHRDVETEILPYCDSERIALLAYYPLGHGRLPSDSRLDPLGSSYGKTGAQVALRWLAEKPNVFPIPRASKVEHVRENSGASDWKLSESEREELDRTFR
jgi:diketogulonate reductase-like aldo/keto reductase